MNLSTLKIIFAGLCLVGGILLYLLGSGESIVATASGLISAAVGLVAGQAGTVSKATLDNTVAVEKAKARRITAETIAAARRGE